MVPWPTQVPRTIGGSREEVSYLYTGVVRSTDLYGALVWSKDLGSSCCKAQLRRLQRLIAIRIIRGYRTISFKAGSILARDLPIYILADMDSNTDLYRLPIDNCV